MSYIRRLAIAAALLSATAAIAADHNDPNAINSIFSDVDINAADLYDFFGFPSDDTTGGEKVVVALTFAPVPAAGIFDTDMLYKIKLDPDPRPATLGDHSLDGLLAYAKAIEKKFLELDAAEIRVTVDQQGRASVSFIGFPGDDFSTVVDTNRVARIDTPDGAAIPVYIGGRDDAFFNDLPGFFRSINYAPQFYHVPREMTGERELPIPKTLIELDGNTLFNFDPKNPRHGQGVKMDLPPGDHSLSGHPYKKDAKGNYRFVYSGKDAQAGININAIILEIPLAFLTKSPQSDRVVNAWGESWVLKASHKIDAIPDDPRSAFGRFCGWFTGLFTSESKYEEQMESYKLVDTDGVPFEDAALSERLDARQLGADNLKLARTFVTRFAHLGWGFGPSVSALGLPTCFDHDDSPISVHKTYTLATEAFPRVKKCLFQRLRMPDDRWDKRGLGIPLKQAVEIFIPNVCAIDMDTTGSWPYGRRPEDQVATRFLSVFLDMEKNCGATPCTLESLGNQALWNTVPITPKTPPNPLKNDKPFLTKFPYLADPW